MNVGRDPGDATRAFDGRMDDIAWFNTVLNATERNALRTVGVEAAQADIAGANAAGRLNATSVAGGNLVAYWNLNDAPGTTVAQGDGGTSIALSIGPQVEGAQFVIAGGPTLPVGGSALNAVVFDGNKDFIRTADSTSLDFDKSQGTISFWVRPDQLTVDNNASTGYIALVEDSNQQIFVGISRQQNAGASFGNADFFSRIVFSPFENTPTSNQNVVVGNTRLTEGVWTHVAVTWNFASQTASIFINGALDTTIVNNTTNPAVWTQAAGNTGDWIFGADGKTQAHGLLGAMADIAVYGNALRASEVQSLYQTGAADSGSFDLAGARGRFTWDDTYVYGLIESYPAGPGAANGPFDNLELDLYINDRTGLAARLDASVLVPVNNVAGSTVAPSGSDVQLYEFRIPIAAIDDLIQPFDPAAGDSLRYRLRTIDGNTAGSGFDTRDTTLGWIVEPPITSDGLRRLEFARTENFFGVGGRLNYTNFAHLTINAGDGIDTLTVVDSQIAPAATNPTRTFTINAGGGNDVVSIDAVDSAFTAAVTIDGQLGVDQVTIDAPLTLGSAISTGNLEVTAETIALNSAINTAAGTVGDISLHVSSTLAIADAANLTAGGNVLIDGVGATSTAANITTVGGDITIKTATTLADSVTFDSAGGDIAFADPAATLDGPFNLTLDADSGDIRFDGVGGGAGPLSALIDVVITAAHDVTINEAFTAESIAHTAGTGTTTFNGAVTLSEAVDTALALNTPEVVVNASVSSAGGQFQITTDDIAVAAALNVNGVGDRLITLVERTADRDLELGGNTAGRLALDAAELAFITAKTLRFGDNLAGDLHLSAPVVSSGVTNLHLQVGGGVSGAGTITATHLAVEAVDDVRLANDNNVQTLAIQTTGPGSEISYRDTDDFTLDDVDGVGGIATENGDVTLETPAQVSQAFFGSIVARGLQLLGGSALLDLQTNDIDVLAADLDGTLDFGDTDDVKVGSVQTFGPATVGITTTNDSVTLFAGQTLSLEEAIAVGSAQVNLTSDFGAIDDVGAVAVKIDAMSLALRADQGIGVTQALQTDVSLLAAANFSAGGIRIDDVSGNMLTLGTVVGPVFSTVGLINLGLGGTVINHLGGLVVANLVGDAGGGITLTTTSNGGDDDHLVVNAPVLLASLGGGDITFTAGTDLLVNNTGDFDDVRNFGSGSIIGTAARDVVLGSDVRIRSLTGAIVGIPPLLENLTAPQIANTGEGSVTFDFGRNDEFHFTAVVDWADGVVDTIELNQPARATTTAFHIYTGNPNLADPAAPIPVTVVLRSDSLIRFTGYETSTAQILLTFPGDGVKNVRIDTTVKVRHLTAEPPQRITAAASQTVPVQGLSNVYNSGGAALQTTESAARVVILREVLPDGREGSAVRFPQAALDDLPALFKKLRNGRYRVYLFEPETQTLRTVLEVDVREGKPAVPTAGDETEVAPADGAFFIPPANDDIDAELTPELPTADASRQSSAHVAALSAATAGVGLALAASDESWSRRVDGALSQFRKFSRLRPLPKPRRKLPR